jgi:hypothetical protein
MVGPAIAAHALFNATTLLPSHLRPVSGALCVAALLALTRPWRRPEETRTAPATDTPVPTQSSTSS